METQSDLSNSIEAIKSDPEIDDFFIVISSKAGIHLEGKILGPVIIAALAKSIVEQEGGLSTINRMQLAIFKAKELAKQIIIQNAGLAH